MEQKHYTDEKSVQIVLAVLKTHGIRKVIASPGTTNLTLVASMQYDPYFEIYSSVDERSAAYMACGMAEESGEPVVITCTGATASRNYMPGLTEAYYRKLPVLAITANQGVSKIGHLVAQNIDRTVLPNDIAMESVSIAACNTAEDEWNCEVLANKAILALYRHGGGPAHINLSTKYSRDYSVRELPKVRAIRRIFPNQPHPELPEGRIAFFVGSHKPFTAEETRMIDAFCAEHDAVVFCDHTSGYYGKYRVQAALLAAQPQHAAAISDIRLLLHVGEVSGDYYGMGIAYRACEVWRISDDGEIRDTFRHLTHVFEMPLGDFLTYYKGKGVMADTYLNECKALYADYLSRIPELPFGNIWVAKHLSQRIPENSVLHLGILNTLRSWNFFELPDGVRSNANVGGFGIDGDISSLIGASLVNPDKLYFIILGDLAFFYDMNVLGNRHVGRNVRILLINNARGTEFRNYNHPGHAFGEEADLYIAAAGHYGNASPVLVKHYAQDLGFEYHSADSKESLDEVADRFVNPRMAEKPMLLEVFTTPDDESDALETIANMVQAPKTPDTPAKQVKTLAKKVLGESSVAALKKFMGR